jgi:hypothetical protein
MTHKAVRIPTEDVAPPATFTTNDSVWVGQEGIGPGWRWQTRLEGAAALFPLAVQPVEPVQPMRVLSKRVVSVVSKRLELAGTVAPLLLVAQPKCPAVLAKAV